VGRLCLFLASRCILTLLFKKISHPVIMAPKHNSNSVTFSNGGDILFAEQVGV
jgi:hypothetical protein